MDGESQGTIHIDCADNSINIHFRYLSFNLLIIHDFSIARDIIFRRPRDSIMPLGGRTDIFEGSQCGDCLCETFLKNNWNYCNDCCCKSTPRDLYRWCDPNVPCWVMKSISVYIYEVILASFIIIISTT